MLEDVEYISLKEATRYCNYSQEYLSLRARQGKLKSVKFGRSWLIKKEWLGEYLKETKIYNNKSINYFSAKIRDNFLSAKRDFIIPKNFSITKNLIKENYAGSFMFRKNLAALFSLVLILLLCGLIFSQPFSQKIFINPETSTMSVQNILQYVVDVFEKCGQKLDEIIKYQVSKITF